MTDFRALLRLLAGAGVEFIVVGGEQQVRAGIYIVNQISVVIHEVVMPVGWVVGDAGRLIDLVHHD